MEDLFFLVLYTALRSALACDLVPPPRDIGHCTQVSSKAAAKISMANLSGGGWGSEEFRFSLSLNPNP